MTDIVELLSQTHREIRDDGDGTRSVLLRRRYDAAVEDVWSACTEPDRLNRWFLPVSGDLRPGGKFQLEGNAGGEVLRCEPPRLLTVTWVYGEGPASEVELSLTPDGAATVLRLSHSRIAPSVEIDGRQVDPVRNDPESGMWGIGTGWEMPLTFSLPRYLAGELPDAPASEWFEFTPEIAEIADRCGQAWAAVG